jgi:exonuclease SbcD
MKQPLAVWVTDTHLKEDTIEVNKSVFRQVLDLCSQLNVPLIHGGDVFDSRKGQPESVLTCFSNILNDFRSREVRFLVIPGNHDKTSYLSQDSFLNAFETACDVIKNYYFIDHSDTGLRFHFIPYFDEKLAYGRYLQTALDNIRFDFKNILFTHIAVNGVKNNDGSKIVNDLTLDKFKFFDKILVGHYHNKQSVDNVIYTGSAYQANFGEDEKKGCTVIYDDGSIEFVQLQFPLYRTLNKKSSKTELIVPENDGNHYRVTLNYKPSTEEVKHFESLGAKIKVDFEVELNDRIKEVKTQFTQSDILQYFDTWCNEKQIEDKEFGLQLLK